MFASEGYLSVMLQEERLLEEPTEWEAALLSAVQRAQTRLSIWRLNVCTIAYA